MNPDKRKIIQRIIREAKERVESARKLENKKRVKKGNFKYNSSYESTPPFAPLFPPKLFYSTLKFY